MFQNEENTRLIGLNN